MLQTFRSIGITGILLIFSTATFAQTNGSWLGLSGNWSDTARWEGGIIPDNGGIATFNQPLVPYPSGRTVTIDNVSRTLSEFRFDSYDSTTIASSGGAYLSLNGNNITFNSIYSYTPDYNLYSWHTVSALIAGSGNIIKTGTGRLSISNATNSFSGAIKVNQGILQASDAALGNVANSIELDGGGIQGTFARTIQIAANGGEFAGVTHTGALNGSGSLLISETTVLQGNGSGFNGALFLEDERLTLSGNGRLGGATIVLAGEFNVNNSSTNVNNRLGGGAIVGRGGELTITGNSGAATTEAAGSLTLEYGETQLNVSANNAQASTLSFTGLSRQHNATFSFQGSSLGSTPGAGVSNILFSTSPGLLIGGGGSPITSTTASILPWGYSVGLGASFVTWDAGTQRIIPLNTAAGYATNLSTAGTQDNVNQGVGVTLASPKTINSLRLASNSPFTIGGSLITVSSGAVLQTSTGQLTPTPFPALTISAPLTAGANELILFSTGGAVASGTGLIINGAISGTGGLTISGHHINSSPGIGVVYLLGNNTYSGNTTLTSGNLVIPGGTLTADGSAPSSLGQDTTAIRLVQSSNGSNLTTTGNLTINRDLDVRLAGSGTVSLSTLKQSSNESITVNGNVALNKAATNTLGEYLILSGGQDRTNAITINGTVSGNGGLTSNGSGYNILNGNNTYSGGTRVGTNPTWTGTGDNARQIMDTWEIGSDTAFGTGTITAYGGVFIANGGARTISNPISIPYGIRNQTGFTAARLNFDGNYPITLTGPVDLGPALNNGVTLSIGANSPLTITGAVSHGALYKFGAGTLTLSGTNTYNRPTIIAQGVVSVSNIGNGGVAGNLGAAPSTQADELTIAGNAVGTTGILRYTGSGESTNRLLTLSGSGGTIDSSGSGALTFSNTNTIWHAYGPEITTIVFNNQGGKVLEVGTLITAGTVVGSAVTGSNVPAGTIVTEVGPGWLRLNNVISGLPTITITAPASLMPVRTLTLTGSNTGLNTFNPVLANNNGFDFGLPLAVNKTGSGTWSLNGANTYSGGTTVNNGTLLVNNTTGSGTGTGAVTVNSGSTFGGNGSISGLITINSGGTVAPGDSPGLLTINNDIVFSSGANLVIELNGTTAGVNYDQLAVNGGITLGDANLLLNLGFAPSTSDFFYIVNNDLTDDILGNFAALPQGSDIFATFGGSTYKGTISYTGNYNTNNFLGAGNDIVIFGFTAAAIPEPGASALIGLSLPIFVFLLRRRNA